ncbi:MAG: NAD(P)H-dependent oxidoreductase [Proteobacteria bacterium]|nr:NAD(P)H-dependent oxidoreductase [Pseudomonadota bacterium]
MPIKLNIIVGSTRPGRIGLPIAKWFNEAVSKDARFEPALVDLAEINLPMFDEPKHPLMQDYQHEHTKKWSKIVAAADAYVFVTPEYDYFAPAPLINALTYLSKEWHYKAAGLVSYGGVSGGLRSAQSIKLMLTGLKMMPLPEGVPMPFAGKQIENGVFKSNELIDLSVKNMLDELAKWTGALAALHAK